MVTFFQHPLSVDSAPVLLSDAPRAPTDEAISSIRELRPYLDRHHAGRSLAQALAAASLGKTDLVIAVPRGGVPVGFQVARELKLPLDILMLAPLDLSPRNASRFEVVVAAAGATPLDGDRFLLARERNRPLASRLSDLSTQLRICEDRYRQGRPALPVVGKSVILVDDGLATGRTLRSAASVLHQLGARRVTVATPVGSEPGLHLLQGEVHRVICPTPLLDPVREDDCYQFQNPTTDEEIEACLAACPGSLAPSLRHS